MLLAGIQAEFGLDPRLKHSGVTIGESHFVAPAAIYEGGHIDHKFKKIYLRRTQKALPAAFFLVFEKKGDCSFLVPVR
jgi:hypothetical protein